MDFVINDTFIIILVLPSIMIVIAISTLIFNFIFTFI